MKHLHPLAIATFLMALSAFTIIKSGNWKVGNDYSIRHRDLVFKGLKASIIFDEEHPEKSKITASVDARTVNTGNGIKNAHFREALHTDKYPIITFVSSSVTKTSNGYETTGNLTLNGITKPVTFPFTFDSKKTGGQFPFIPKETFSGILTVNKEDFKLKGDAIPGKVDVELSIPVFQ